MRHWKAIKIAAVKAGLLERRTTLRGIPYRSLVRRSRGMSENEFWDYQANAFDRIYDFARDKVPYYHKRPGVYPTLLSQDNHILEILATLPILRKQIVRERNRELWASPPLPHTNFHTTSGSTGTPLQLAVTLQERAFGQAAIEEWQLRVAGKRYPRTIVLSGFATLSSSSEELFWFDPVSKRTHLSIYSLSLPNRDRIIDLFKSVKPQLILGYASAAHQLAQLLGDSVLGSKEERVAILTSEVLQPHWRMAIENSLCGKVYDIYGAAEETHLVMQCDKGRMHINPLIGIVEILDNDGRLVQPGEMGRVVVTGLVRRSMPLIRYEIGDVAESSGYATDCPCGLKWPTIGQVQGRFEDLVLTRDGRKIGMLSQNVMKNLKGIKEAQIVQKSYEKFTIKIVKSETEPTENKRLEEMIAFQVQKRPMLPSKERRLKEASIASVNRESVYV